MIDLQNLKVLQIKKEMLLITLTEKRSMKTKVYIYLGIFILAVLLIGFLKSAHQSSQITDVEYKVGERILKFGGIFFWSGLFLIYRVFSITKEIKAIEQEIDLLNQNFIHLNN